MSFNTHRRFFFSKFSFNGIRTRYSKYINSETFPKYALIEQLHTINIDGLFLTLATCLSAPKLSISTEITTYKWLLVCFYYTACPDSF